MKNVQEEKLKNKKFEKDKIKRKSIIMIKQI